MALSDEGGRVGGRVGSSDFLRFRLLVLNSHSLGSATIATIGFRICCNNIRNLSLFI